MIQLGVQYLADLIFCFPIIHQSVMAVVVAVVGVGRDLDVLAVVVIHGKLDGWSRIGAELVGKLEGN